MTDREKRQFRRISFKKPLEFQTVEHRDGQPCLLQAATVSCDISEAGLRLYIYDFIPLGQELIFHFYLSEEVPLKISGKVVWEQKVPHGEMYQIGIKFIENKETAAVRQQLQNYIHSQK